MLALLMGVNDFAREARKIIYAPLDSVNFRTSMRALTLRATPKPALPLMLGGFHEVSDFASAASKITHLMKTRNFCTSMRGFHHSATL